MRPFELPRPSRPVTVRSHFHQPRYRVVSVRNPFRVDWSRVTVASLAGVVIVLAVFL